MRKLLWAMGVVAAASACGGEDETTEGVEGEGTGAWTSLADRPCPEDSFVSYEDFGGPLMITYCNGCHSEGLAEEDRQQAPLHVNFDTIEMIRAQAERIWVRSADQNETMPPIGGPPPQDRELLGEWLACGAPTYDDWPDDE